MEKKLLEIRENIFMSFNIKRWIIFILGINALSIGIVFNTKSRLGVGSITTLPYVFSQITTISLGNSITLLYFVFVLIQTILLKKIDYKILIQFPFSFIVGQLIDIYDLIITTQANTLIIQISLLIIATFLTALGVYFMIKSDIVLNPSDGIVQTISQVFHQPFGKIKIPFDLSTIALSCLLSFVFMGSLVGVGIGTIINALCIGYCVSLYDKILKIEFVR
ncbi:MAG: YczE/YyaS/YitT family protein [Longibaculum sp.]